MNSKTLNIFMAAFIIFSLVVSVGAEGILVGDGGSISVEQIENVAGETAGDFINQISEETVQTGERVESIPLEDATSENEGADPGQKEVQIVLEEAPLSSQNNEDSLEENVVYIPLGEISEEISPSPSPEENKTNQTTNILSNESQNQEEVSGQEEIEFSPGQIQDGELNETNQTTLPEDNLEENHADVRGNTQEGTGSEDSESVSLSSISSNGEKIIEYVSLTKIIEDELTNGTTNQTEEKEMQMYSYYSDGKKVIEIETFKEVNIKKEEFEENEFGKKVVISSEEHVEDPLRVYIDMQTEVVKSKIKIFWENENLEITKLSEFSVKYYDENGNGLVDRISWMVPHLSTQTFQIVIEPEFVEDLGASQINLNVDGPDGPVTNPLNFNITLNYSNPEFVNCSLIINSSSNSSIINKQFSFIDGGTQLKSFSNIDDGNYFWYLNCQNQTGNIFAGDSKSFSINENFGVTNIEGELFFLDLVKNEIQNPLIISMSSNYNSKKKVTLNKGGQIHFTKEYSSGLGEFITLNQILLNVSGTYNLTVQFEGQNGVNFTKSQTFSVASANITFTPGTYDIDEVIGMSFNINSPVKNIALYSLNLGDPSETPLFGMPGSVTPINNVFSQTYSSEGNKLLNLTVSIQGEPNFFYISKPGINIEYSGDNTPPEIDLDYPRHNGLVYDDEIKFRYTATDNVKLKECLFTLYNVSGSNEVELYAQKDVPENGKEFEVHMVDFEDGEYEWEINCSDNSSNWDYDFNLFEVILDNSSVSSTSNSFTDYDLREEVENSLGELNAFLLEMKDFEADVKEVLEDLGIVEDIDFYKKRLIQIDQYFKENYKYVDTEELRVQKNKEYAEEFENIKNKIPKSIKIIDSLEYVKNSVEIDLKDVVEDYMKSTNTQTSKSFIKKLALANLKLQQEISVEADIKKIEIEYGNETRELILVKKKIDLKSSGYDQILEIIPKEIIEDADDIIFLVENQIIKKDPIFEILKEDLTDNDEIVYYIEKDLDVKDFSKTETILFEESFAGKSSVTGFFAVETLFNADPVYFMIALLLVICLIILFIFVLRKKRVHKWKKEPNVVKCFELLGKANIYIKEKEIERARESYREIKRIYPVLPPKPKDYFYKEVKELSVKIDRRDIFGLVKEYEEAKIGFNKEDCIRIYGKIKKVYERLPLKDRQKIYERISK